MYVTIVAIEMHSLEFMYLNFFELFVLLKLFEPSTATVKWQINQSCMYTLRAATLCSVNGCCSCVLLNEIELQRHQTTLLLFLFAVVFFAVCCIESDVGRSKIYIWQKTVNYYVSAASNDTLNIIDN